jgi:hypothetical protein
MYRFIFRFKS